MSKRFDKKLTERLALVVGVLQPLTMLPQIIQIERTQNVVGVSFITWWMSAFSGLVFLAYGIVHKLKPVIVSQILWFIVQMVVVIQVFIHG